MDLQSSIRILQDNAILSESFSHDEISSLCQYMKIKSLTKGSLLIRKGEPSDFMLFILDGIAEVLDGETQIAIHYAGAFTGESLFSEEATRHADVKAVEDVVFAQFSEHDFSNLMKGDQALALKVREYFLEVRKARLEKNVAVNYVEERKFLALIAHNNMKKSLMEFCRLQSKKLERFPLIATGTTGSMLYEKTGLSLAKKVESGPLGGDQAVGNLISTKNICGIIFFRDPLSPHPHHADIEALGRLCDVYQVPLATNPRSGEAVLDYLLSEKPDQQLIPNHILEAYRRGQIKVIENA